ncbi:hypothetical protein NPIL_533391 [Nephila pilipes]|uniref:Uncharacterized protein n=1 Tax=Nephila pilipes TaxID=299642 RepID=A0A8X6UQE4_NEPPI|nr:hypothetical protein NPIL_533391 [Nephila pilipes]
MKCPEMAFNSSGLKEAILVPCNPDRNQMQLNRCQEYKSNTETFHFNRTKSTQSMSMMKEIEDIWSECEKIKFNPSAQHQQKPQMMILFL